MKNYNNISKSYEEHLYRATVRAEEEIKKIMPSYQIICDNKGAKKFNIDSFAYSKENGKKLFAIELEVATDSWHTYDFRYPTASILVKKEKYAQMDIPAFFVRFNCIYTNAYCVILDETTLKEEFLEKINRRSQGSRAVEGEFRYALPLKLCAWGFENIEPYIKKKYDELIFNKL